MIAVVYIVGGLVLFAFIAAQKIEQRAKLDGKIHDITNARKVSRK